MGINKKMRRIKEVPMKVINSYGRLRRPIPYDKPTGQVSNGVKRIIILMGILALGLVLLAGCRQRPEEGELERKELIPLEEMASPEEMAEAAPTAIPAAGITSINSITQASIGQRVTLKATITSVWVFREAKGRSLKISDGTGSIDVVIWKDLYNQISRRNALVKGTKVQVSGEIGSYRESLQIKPKSPGDIRILGAAPAALLAVAPSTPVTQTPPEEKVVAPLPQVTAKPELKKVDTDGDGIPDTYVLTQEKRPTARPEAVSADTIQVTDITRSGQNEFALVINGSLVIKGFKKMSGQRGEWVAMPGYEKKDGAHKDLIYPITQEARKVINEAILHNKINPQAVGPIEITEATKPSSYAGTKAYGSLIINKSLALEIKVREGQYGDWIAMPSKKGEDGRYYDLTYPITPPATEAIKKAKDMVLNKYKTIK